MQTLAREVATGVTLFDFGLLLYGIKVAYSNRLRSFWIFLVLLLADCLLVGAVCYFHWCYGIVAASRLLLALYWKLMGINSLDRVVKESFNERVERAEGKEELPKQDVFI